MIEIIKVNKPLQAAGMSPDNVHGFEKNEYLAIIIVKS